MKKAYVKPVLYFENFELNANIAASCATPIHNSARDACGLEIDGIGVAFLDGISGCKYKGKDGNFGVCYHNPTDTTNLFNSL